MMVIFMDKNLLRYFTSLLFLLFFTLAPQTVFAATKSELVILNWSEYMDPEIIKYVKCIMKVMIHVMKYC